MVLGDGELLSVILAGKNWLDAKWVGRLCVAAILLSKIAVVGN